MGHKIHLDDFADPDQRQGFTFLDLDKTSVPGVRLLLLEFKRLSYKDDVLLVDSKEYGKGLITFKKFALFLKILEDESMKGEIWFFNRSLSDYPITIRTRCETIPKPFKENTFSQDMVDSKEFFIDFLYNLDVLKQNNFYVLYTYIQKMKEVHKILFSLWLSKSIFFSKKELSACAFLHTERFKKVYDSFFMGTFYEYTEVDPKVLFLFLVCFKVLRMR